MKEWARKLRKRQSNAETLLWFAIRGLQLGWKLRRQHIIEPYIVDFVCFEKRFIIELDGEHDDRKGDYDLKRSLWLKSEAIVVARYWTRDFFDNFDEILKTIYETLEGFPKFKRPLHNCPLT